MFFEYAHKELFDFTVVIYAFHPATCPGPLTIKDFTYI